MKKQWKRIVLAATAALLFVSMTACSEGAVSSSGGSEENKARGSGGGKGKSGYLYASGVQL